LTNPLAPRFRLGPIFDLGEHPKVNWGCPQADGYRLISLAFERGF